MIKNTRILKILFIAIMIISLTACSSPETGGNKSNMTPIPTQNEVADITITPIPTPIITVSVPIVSPEASPTVKLLATATPKPSTDNEVVTCVGETLTYDKKDYKIIEVDGGNMAGKRLSNVAVDVGFGDRIYWALTNEYGQLIHVIADRVILQDDKTESVTSDGRYYPDEADVPGTS